MTASTLATLLTQPVDVVRTRLQLNAGSSSASPAGPPQWTTGTVVWHSMRELVRREGAAAVSFDPKEDRS